MKKLILVSLLVFSVSNISAEEQKEESKTDLTAARQFMCGTERSSSGVQEFLNSFCKLNKEFTVTGDRKSGLVVCCISKNAE